MCVAATIAWACGTTTEFAVVGGAPIATVAVNPSTPTLVVGTSVPLQAVVQDASGRAIVGLTVVWTVRDSAIARVSSAGVVTGRSVGTTQVAANVNGTSGIAAITVAKPPVASVVVLPNRVSLAPGQTSPLTAVVYDAAYNVLADRSIIWTTSNGGVATVTANGVVTSVAPGTATVSGIVEGKSDSASVTVTLAPVATVEVSPSQLAMSAGQTTQMSATARDAGGAILTGRPVTWSTSDTLVATVTSQGVVAAIAPGAAVIRATIEGRTGSAAILVSFFAVGSVSVQPIVSSVGQSASEQLTAIVRDVTGALAINRVITWSSGNSAIATVSANGVVTGVSPGLVTIRATCEGVSGNANVTVTGPAVAVVTVQPSAVSITVGKTATLTATLKDAGGNLLTGRTVTWKSNDTTVAKVSTTGVVMGTGRGTATITATSEGKSGTATVTVTTATAAPGQERRDPPSRP
jgi:uncharacterized protein YjdB